MGQIVVPFQVFQAISILFSILVTIISVVGAGIGGSAVAHFLQQHFGPRVQIDVYEKGTVGGRLATISVNKQHYESGAASFHSLSLHMQDFVKLLDGAAETREGKELT
uniref:Uncharacterized protein n=1 Tax=Spermophilus dauricus TaxID=99837 RepID=A0A8C9QCB5_SPEDA